MISYVMSKTNQIENKKEQVEQKIVNGVNVTKLAGTIDAIRSSPIISKFNFRAKGEWIKGGHNQITINDFYGAGQTHSRSQPFIYDDTTSSPRRRSRSQCRRVCTCSSE
jgi:hypothetical protein